jgi:FKBP-type peptidyl-prolyl cis-trans isomerase 2
MTDEQQIAKAGDDVQIHYTGTLDDGSTFDSSEGRDPLAFKLGSGQVIKGFDDGVTGMSVCEEKTIHIPCEDAYGPINPAMMQDVPREQIPAEIPLELGMMLQMQGQAGDVIPVKVANITEDTVTLDANHMLAGKDLTFALKLVSIGA